MDIDIELNKLIVRYNLDVSKELISVKTIIEKILEKYSNLSRIGIRCAGDVTVDFLDNFYGKLKIVAIFDKNPSKANIKLKKYNIPIVSIEEMDKYKLDAIIISTITYRDEIKSELKNSNIKYIIDWDEELQDMCNISLNGNIKAIENNPYLYIIAASYLYNHSCEKKENNQIIKNIISNCLKNRDIYLIDKWIREYIAQDYVDKENYVGFLKDFLNLIKKIKNILKYRNKRDIIVLWQDALCYKEVEYMPFMKKCREKGLYFKNAKSTIAWTRGVMKAILDKQLLIDNYYDDKVCDKGHKLTELFKENGYDCKYIGVNKIVDLHTFNLEDSRNKLNDFDPISHVYWNLLKCLIMADKPIMAIAHSIYETHLPNCTPNLINYYMGIQYLPFEPIDSYNKWNIQMQDALKYVDKQTEILLNILDEKIIKIIMSDHGKLKNRNSRGWDFDALNINFLVIGQGIKPEKIKDIFSINEFYELIKYVIYNKKEDFYNIFKKYIKFQGLNIYNKYFIERLIYNNLEEQGVAFRGVETLKDRYVLIETGQEIYNILPDEKTNYINDEKYKDRIELLRKKAGNNFIDIEKEPQFEYSKLLYDSLKKKGRV